MIDPSPFLFCGFMNFMQGSKKNCHHFFSPLKSLPTVTLIIICKLLNGGFFGFFQYFIQPCFICRPSDSTVSEDAGIENRTVGIEPAGQLNRTALHTPPSCWCISLWKMEPTCVKIIKRIWVNKFIVRSYFCFLCIVYFMDSGRFRPWILIVVRIATYLL